MYNLNSGVYVKFIRRLSFECTVCVLPENTVNLIFEIYSQSVIRKHSAFAIACDVHAYDERIIRALIDYIVHSGLTILCIDIWIYSAFAIFRYDVRII